MNGTEGIISVMAKVVELVYTSALRADSNIGLRVRVPPLALVYYQ